MDRLIQNNPSRINTLFKSLKNLCGTLITSTDWQVIFLTLAHNFENQPELTGAKFLHSC